MPYVVKPIDEQKLYEQFLERKALKPHATFLHSWQWGEVMKSESKSCMRLGIYDGKKLVGVAQIMRKPLRIGGYFWYCPRGIALDYRDLQVVRQAYRALSRYVRRQGGAFLRVDPDLVQGDPAEKVIDRLFPVKAPIFTQAERVWCVDLQADPDSQLAWMKDHGMRKNIPYYLRRAAKEGVTVVASSKPHDLEKLITMLGVLRQRKQMVGASDEHLRRQFAALAPKGYEKVFLAKKDGHVLASALVSIYGREASYLHGASMDLFKEFQAPHTLHFEIMTFLIKEHPEVERYNFWGIVSDKNRNSKHPRHGYSEFKRSFGGYKETYMRGRDFVYNSLYWRMDWLLQKYWAWKFKND